MWQRSYWKHIGHTFEQLSHRYRSTKYNICRKILHQQKLPQCKVQICVLGHFILRISGRIASIMWNLVSYRCICEAYKKAGTFSGRHFLSTEPQTQSLCNILFSPHLKAHPPRLVHCTQLLSPSVVSCIQLSVEKWF